MRLLEVLKPGHLVPGKGFSDELERRSSSGGEDEVPVTARFDGEAEELGEDARADSVDGEGGGDGGGGSGMGVGVECSGDVLEKGDHGRRGCGRRGGMIQIDGVCGGTG